MRDEDESKHFEVHVPRGKKTQMPAPQRGMMAHHPDDSHLVAGFNSAHHKGHDGIPHPHRLKTPRF